jgi:chemotaxis protein MotB
MPLARRSRRTLDIWPGFVDAMATLLMVIIFVVMVFVLAQFFLSQALSGSEREVSRLGGQLASLVEQLNLEKAANANLKGDLMTSVEERDLLATELTSSRDEAGRLGHDVAALKALKQELEAKLAELGNRLGEQEGQLVSERRLSEEARAQAALLNRQLEAMKADLARIAAALDASEKKAKDQGVQLVELGKKLNSALAGKVEELQKYRSEFFGRLRQALGDRPGIRIEGDRFVFQSELLFDTASAELGAGGVEQVRQLAGTLKDVSKAIPKGVNWVLRVDGHTDKRAIAKAKFPSNWELSTARAIMVVRTLIANGIPADRLVAAGFGEFQPLDGADTEAAWAKNRRIEIRLDQR